MFVKRTFEWDSTAAGLIFLCAFLPGITAPLPGMAADKYGAKWPSVAGFAGAIPVLVCMRFVSENTIGHKVLLCVLVTLAGLLLIWANTPLNAEIVYCIDDMERERPGLWGKRGVYGIGFGMFTTAFALGTTVGSFVAGYIMDAAGWNTLTWVTGLWAFAGMVPVLIWTKSKPLLRRDAAEQAAA